eukprot:14061125-Alexandrium_andersonii.AAC.1
MEFSSIGSLRVRLVPTSLLQHLDVFSGLCGVLATIPLKLSSAVWFHWGVWRCLGPSGFPVGFCGGSEVLSQGVSGTAQCS